MAENRVRAALVDVLRHCRDEGRPRADALDELPLMRDALAVGDDGEQALVGRVAHAHHGMAEKPAAAVLVIGGNAHVLRRAGDGVQRLACVRSLDQAFGAWDDAVRAARVEARAHASVRAGREGRGRLMTIANGLVAILVHAVDLEVIDDVSREDVREERGDGLALALELDGVGHCQPLASAATLGDRAGVRLEPHASPHPAKRLDGELVTYR